MARGMSTYTNTIANHSQPAPKLLEKPLVCNAEISAKMCRR